MKKFTIQAVVLVVVILAALAFATSKIPQVPFVSEQPKLSEIRIKDVPLKVEIADTAGKRQKGLGDRESLASDSGMLFIFPETKTYNFWMKGLRFPLDIIWIRGEEIVDIILSAAPPEPGQSDDTLPIYTSKREVDKVLEVNAGFVTSHNIRVGDKLEFVK